MTDKTSWTKPPFRHRYGDSRLAVWGAEGVLGSPPPPPPEGGEEPRRPTGAERPGAAASGRAPPGAEQRGSAGSWSGIGRTGVPVRNMHGKHLHEPGEGSRAGRRDAQRPVASRAQLPRRVPAKTDRTSSWQFGRLPGALRAPGSLSDRGEPRVEVQPHAGPSAVRGPERLRANPAQLLEALERALHETQGSVRLVHSWRYTPRAR